MSDQPNRRNTRALEPALITDPIELAKAEARNGLKQYDAGVQAAQTAIERGGFKLRPSLICSLHREALDGLSSYAGIFRPGGVEIGKSKHEPPPAHLVPELVENLCDYVNNNWERSTALHLAAYVMWRLNWIHPFADGNGRTSRTVSDVVLSIRAGYVPSGSPSIPDQIVKNRTPYFEALEAADEAWKQNILDLSKMESFLETLLARQLRAFFESVGGKLP
ncbi:Fic family protein [Methylocapsa sp. D3K7]|uniref:Fic family protein n=1 Tax=Methylocapsa sp. D3K7 TaxID=3041435 RepID=UPI00244EB9C6|nr:Fic family protein [Methylocapsa sp. D3K7]WGJ13098.1 Fic family protein [Methylocapsa sp. D3K7]